jgi:1D-myo-inositol-tetrakisphosphate 5-kinase/inositol-polyphosphate multikinase
MDHPRFAYYIPNFMGTISFVGKSGSSVAALMGSLGPDQQQHSAIHQIPDAMVREKAWAPSGGGKIRTDSGIVLENITANYRKFNVLDVKLGARLWADDAPQAKREKMENEANATTSKALGIRIAGMRIYTGQDATEPREVDADDGVDRDPFGQIDPTGGGYRIYDKHYGRSLTPDTVHKGFEKFFRVAAGKPPDADIAKVLRAFLTDLEGLRSVLESEECRIYSSSLLFVYEGDVEALREAIRLKENPPNLDHADGAAPSPQPTLPDEIVSTDKSASRPRRETLTDYVTPSGEPLRPECTKTLHEAEEASADAADDKDSDGASPPLRIQALKLIDFAHAQWTKGQGPDENLLYGINNVIKILHEIINR